MPSTVRRLLSPLLTLLAAVSIAGCSGDGDGSEVTVFAASSLSDVFSEVADARAEGGTVRFNFASSAALATQIEEGAPADVFASADLAQMERLRSKGLVGEAFAFATGRPVIVVAKGSRRVTELGDLAKPGVRLVLAAKDVPIGGYARQVLARASSGALGGDFSEKALANLRSEELNVRAVLVKVQLGEADAGIVYATDIAAGGDGVRAIEIPAEFNVTARYFIAVVHGGEGAAEAQRFIAFVLRDEGQAILRQRGFGPP